MFQRIWYEGSEMKRMPEDDLYAAISDNGLELPETRMTNSNTYP